MLRFKIGLKRPAKTTYLVESFITGKRTDFGDQLWVVMTLKDERKVKVPAENIAYIEDYCKYSHEAVL